MGDAERKFALQKFAEYYEKTAKFEIPSIEKREFGIGNVKKIDGRHLSFANESEFRNYLVSNTPFFVSHSAAYYERPGATPIEKKGWQGADLIFDLDLHASGKYGAYPLLGKVKDDVFRLAEEFLSADFGISKSEIAVVFSGNRGYHVHVRDDAYLDLGSDERRELVDYINGNGLNYLDFFYESEVPGRRFSKKIGPTDGDYGYRGRFVWAVLEKLKKEPETVSRVFKSPDKMEKLVGEIRNGNWSRISEYFDRLKPIADELPIRSINTDAGVTQDVSKLIRVPNSIHGETGLIAKLVGGTDQLGRFEPMKDAVLPVNGIQKIKFIEDVPEIEFAGETLGPFKKDEEKELAVTFALFLTLKGSAALSEYSGRNKKYDAATGIRSRACSRTY